ncbi:LacI family DNA-binding transcriptional regulator [Pigmentiphaga litoralis]|uniref:DNA-binding LacI/PurR family transcriptional regulator n=1 Tax=Pigmentiphaga litoralis TaxID=516702 RepID=A0A7Y9IS02_9BURK|nr:DNA-binding LacI/PurR family transcriptional regulator [Pigmentiphaga litoralis]NYE81924.1 DNA-binding LacI/PurR family transcriptional regulator [Pigmentiphaga litoralis]
MSIKQLAARADVSMATVSRVFNFPDKVSADTRQHVLRIAQELGYLPNASARSLRTQCSKVLGIVLPTLLNPVFAECLDGIAQAARAAGYAILPITTDYELEREEQAVLQLIAADVDGMVLVVSQPATSRALDRLRAASLPYVLAYNRHADHPCVSVDNETAVIEMVARLVALGHRRIAFISGELAASDRALQRQRGFCEGMQAHGLDTYVCLEVPFIETAIQDIGALLDTPGRPTALVCSNDLIAIRSIRAAHLAGLTVPRDISIAGFDGIALGRDLTPALSTITQPNQAIGRDSVQWLVAALASGQPLAPHASRLLPHAFRTGESCTTAPDSPSSSRRARVASLTSTLDPS